MIDSVHFENFKSLKNTSVQFGQLTVLVGPNGCGKSSVLEAMSLAAQVCAPPPEEYSEYQLFAITRLPNLFSGRRKPQRLLTQGSKNPIRLSLRSVAGDDLELSVPVRAPHDRSVSGEAKLTIL
ncbi:MAG TPA: AAA family ATPase, partial [Polyangiaceae bacterium]|nr:AAA family ATPase [Polyangiaceae bacterium]